MAAEKPKRFIDGQVEHLVEIAPLEADAEDMTLEAASVAVLAADLEIGHEMHLDRHAACPAASLAAPAGYVERKMARRDTELARLRDAREEPADVVVDLEIGGQVGANRARGQLLTHVHHVADRVEPFDP